MNSTEKMALRPLTMDELPLSGGGSNGPDDQYWEGVAVAFAGVAISACGAPEFGVALFAQGIGIAFGGR